MAETIDGDGDLYAEVAVPVPFPGALIYCIPASLQPVEAGCRVRVRMGPRRLIGVIIRVGVEKPTDFQIREIEEVLDAEPVLGSDLLHLAKFTSEYYAAPIGEVIRAMLPGKLPPWGHRRIALTNAGALAVARSDDEARLMEYLLEHRRVRLGEARRILGIAHLSAMVEALRERGWIAVEEPGASTAATRYVQAVELRPGDLEEHLAACGRSVKGRAVIEYLAALGRPATVRELTNAVGCGSSVVKRLADLELLRRFTQPENLSLARHRLHSISSEGSISSQGGERPKILLRPDQQSAVDALSAALASAQYRPFLLHGMTGSGKTEVYLRIVEEALRAGRTALLLVPEIALVPALAATARERFGRDLAILHSNLSSAERHQEWERLRRGEARIVLGPRSALFAPIENLGILVVDEEHDAAYKQETTPRYNGRDLALLRAREHGAVAVLASATPSLESRFNVERGKLAILHLTERAGHGRLPEGILVDLREEGASRRPGEVHFSGTLCGEIEATIADGDQVILLRNRRGYSPILLCRACGEDFRCPDCGLPFTYHRQGFRLVCHYCSREQGAPKVCSSCGEGALEPVGAGTERVEEIFRELFPGVSVDVLDADANQRTGGAAAVLERFSNGKTQVLIGTQMVAKGHHFPRVALAGVLFADTYLSFPDFRAVERTYALLTQLAGRAGRGERPGRVVIQTFHPQHYAIRAALENNDAMFVEEEMRFRRTYLYPPFSRMALLLVRHKTRAKAAMEIRELARRIKAHPLAQEVRITGPALAPLERMRGKWRFQLLLRTASGAKLRRLLTETLASGCGAELLVDIDPQELM